MNAVTTSTVIHRRAAEAASRQFGVVLGNGLLQVLEIILGVGTEYALLRLVVAMAG
jgi:hypothetical protein